MAAGTVTAALLGFGAGTSTGSGGAPLAGADTPVEAHTSQRAAQSAARIHRLVCRALPDQAAAQAPKLARCHARVATQADEVTPVASVSPVPGSYGPAELQSAYRLPAATAEVGQTVAVVAAYDNPNAERDLGVYRSYFGLPPCTTANGCFRKLT